VAGAVALVLCAGTALADEGSQYTITVTNAHAGQTYTAYKVFDVTTNGNDGFSYSLNNSDSSKGDFIGAVNEAIPGLLVKQGDSHYYGVDANMLTAETAKSKLVPVIKQYLDKNGLTGLASATADAEGGNVTLNVGAPGYYFVSSTTGSLCVLNTAAPTAQVVDKNTVPTVEKMVYSVSGDTSSKQDYSNATDASIGDTVTFRVKVTAPEGASNVVLCDQFPAGITFDPSSVKVKTVDGSDVAADKYDLDTTATNDYTFKLTFKDEVLAAAGEYLTVEYSGTLNESAIIGSTGNVNSARITYGANMTPSEKTTATVKTWSFNVKKIDATTKNPLANAQFALSTTNDKNGIVKFEKVGGDDSTTYVRAADQNADGLLTIITTDDSGIFTLQGLDSGTYYLLEVKAPDGYNAVSGPITVTVNADGSVSGHVDGTVAVENSTGTLLPGTGGIGTTVFYVVGGILVVGAVVALVTKKKMSAHK